MIAEESTAFPGVSKPTSEGGLGFSYKWNMGWMHDTLKYIQEDPIHRQYHHDKLTFGMVYAYSEHFVLPISHDEVVHGKGSLIDKMPGDRWQKFANLRAYLSFMWTHPGKKLLFMGSEFGQWREWNHDRELDWHLLEDADHRGVQNLVRDLNRLYSQEPALHELDSDPRGFQWLIGDDRANSVFAGCARARPAIRCWWSATSPRWCARAIASACRWMPGGWRCSTATPSATAAPIPATAAASGRAGGESRREGFAVADPAAAGRAGIATAGLKAAAMKNAARGNLSGVFKSEFNSLLTRGGGLHSEMRDQDRVPQMPVPQPVSWETGSWSPACCCAASPALRAPRRPAWRTAADQEVDHPIADQAADDGALAHLVGEHGDEHRLDHPSPAGMGDHAGDAADHQDAQHPG